MRAEEGMRENLWDDRGGAHGRRGRPGGGGGGYFGDDFTDHLPVEMKCHFWPMQNRRTTPQVGGEEQIVLPQIEKLAVPGREAKELRKKWHELLQARLRDHQSEQRLCGMGGHHSHVPGNKQGSTGTAEGSGQTTTLEGT